jgi:hypothetical protein
MLNNHEFQTLIGQLTQSVVSLDLKYNQVTPIIPFGNNSHTTGLKGRPHARATFSGLESNSVKSNNEHPQE